MSPTPPKLLAPVNEKIYTGLYAPLAPPGFKTHPNYDVFSAA